MPETTPTPAPVAALLDPKKVTELQAAVPKMMGQALDLVIVDNDDYLTAGTFLDMITARKKAVTELFEKPTKEAASVHKFLTTLRAGLLGSLVQAEELMKSRRGKYRADIERKDREDAEAKRKAVKEEQDQQALEEAARLEEIGETEAADAVIERAATAPAPPVYVPSSVPKEQGHSYRKVYKFRVVDPDKIKREFLMLDESKAGAIVSRLGLDAMPIVGGIEVYTEEIEVIRSGGKNVG